LVVRANGGVELAMLQTRQTQSASDFADPVAQSFQTIAVHYVVVVILMIAACGQLDVDIAAVERCLQDVPQAYVDVEGRPVHVWSRGIPNGLYLAGKSVGKRKIVPHPATTVPVAPLLRKIWQPETERRRRTVALLL
jgi:hypothetical protein